MTTDVIAYIGLSSIDIEKLLQIDTMDIGRHEDAAGTPEFWIEVNENSMRTLVVNDIISLDKLVEIKDKKVDIVLFF